ncbi:MAG: hypothetical protein B9S32_06895 [Verrucomicrobia bacterium Tous-C9LFEB]|nr:MAG: hypothetical protein B9S32_06895 [Verrucomicrobia bacterium Tous-C9LFEB]
MLPIATNTAFFASLPMSPVEVLRIGPFPITNSMVVLWGAALIVIAAVRWATWNLQTVPDRKQGFLEVVIEKLFGILEPILGYEGAKKTFWFFATIFIFIVSMNLFALIPGVGSIGWGEDVHGHFEVTKPLLRGVNADLNMTAAMAVTFALLWIVWSLQALGLKGFFQHIFGSKAELGLKGWIGVLVSILFGLIFFGAGLIEVVSIAFRPVSLSFRLFGNIYGGEQMLESMYETAGPIWACVALIPFYFFELLVAIVQALVFCLLTAAFTGMMIKHDDHGESKH